MADFELVFNPYFETSPELTDAERLQLVRGVVFDSGKVSQRSILCRRTPPLDPDQLRLFAEALIQADLVAWPDEALPSGLWKCVNLRELSCQSSKEITSVSPAIGRMKNLRVLNLSGCYRVRFLPFEVSYTQLPQNRHLLSFGHGYTRDQLPPLPRFPTGVLSLKETIARAIVHDPNSSQWQPGVSLPTDLESYLHSAKRCSKCQGPFFDAYFACWSALDIIWWTPLLSISCSRRCAGAIPLLMVADGVDLPNPKYLYCDYDEDEDIEDEDEDDDDEDGWKDDHANEERDSDLVAVLMLP